MDKTYCLRCGKPTKMMQTDRGPHCCGCFGTDFYYGSEESFLVFKAQKSKDDHMELTKRIIGVNMEVDFN